MQMQHGKETLYHNPKTFCGFEMRCVCDEQLTKTTKIIGVR